MASYGGISLFHTQHFSDCSFTGSNISSLKLPIWEYGRSLGYSVTGGYVYSGINVPELTGKYSYADYGSKRIWALEYDGINPPTNNYLLNAPGSPTSFGVDESDELYVVTFDPNNIYRFTPTISNVDELSFIREYGLKQNFPNPFNLGTRITFSITELTNVTLKVYNVLGNESAILLDESKPAETYTVKFDASDIPSGIYFYTLNAGNYSSTKKMIYLK